jgi:hypothetical protein
MTVLKTFRQSDKLLNGQTNGSYESSSFDPLNVGFNSFYLNHIFFEVR